MRQCPWLKVNRKAKDLPRVPSAVFRLLTSSLWDARLKAKLDGRQKGMWYAVCWKELRSFSLPMTA